MFNHDLWHTLPDLEPDIHQPNVGVTNKKRKASILSFANTQPKRQMKKSVSWGSNMVHQFESEPKPEPKPESELDAMPDPEPEPDEYWVKVWSVDEIEEIEKKKYLRYIERYMAATVIQAIFRRYRMPVAY